MNILFARNFAAAASGSVFYLFTLFSFVIQVVSFSLESGISYYAAKGTIGDRELVGFSISWSVLVTILTCMGIRIFFAGHFPILYAFCFIAGNLLIAFGNAFCYSKFRFVLPSVVALAVNGGLIILLLMKEYGKGVLSGDTFISLYFYSYLVQGVLLFLFLMFTMKIVPALTGIQREAIIKIFRYSTYAFFANFIFLLVSRIDYVFVKKYCTAADLGNYIQVSKLGQLFFILPSMIATVLFPVIAADGKQPVAGRIRTLSVGTGVLYFFLCAGLAIVGRGLFPWIFGSSFDQMYIPFLLLSPGIIFMSFLYPYSAYFAATNRIPVNLKGSLLALVFIVLADAAFIPRYGIRAAALISSVGYCIYLTCVICIFKREFGLSLKEIFFPVHAKRSG